MTLQSHALAAPLVLLAAALAPACSDHNLNPLGEPEDEDYALPPYEHPEEPGDAPAPEAPDSGWADTGSMELNPPEDTDPGEALPCTGSVRTLRLDLDFPARRSCPFGSGDNLEALDAHVQGRFTQLEAFSVDDAATVCALRFAFSASQGGMSFPLRYDDQLLFALNDRVIFASDERMVAALPRDAAGLAVYNWAAVAGMEMDFDPTSWSVGATDVVDLPSHDVAGDAHVEIEDAALEAFRGVSAGQLDFSLVSFGDNDFSDCGHTGLGFWVEIDVEQP